MVLHEVGLVVVACLPIQAGQHVVFLQVELVVGGVIHVIGHQVGQTNLRAVEITAESASDA